MRSSLIALALALAAPSIALAQPTSKYTVGQVLDIEGHVYLPAGGGPIIGVNKSNSFQVKSAPFRALLTQALNRRVKAKVRVVTPGMFGATVDVLSVGATNAGAQPLRVRAGASSASPFIGSIAPGKAFTITGASTHHVAVKLANGRRGHVRRSASIAIGEAPASAADIARLDAFEFTSLIEWGGDHVQVHFKLTRRADGRYVADIDGEDAPAKRTNVPVSDEVVADVVRALTRFQAFPEDSFAGDGNHWHYVVRASGERGDGSDLRFSRAFYEPNDEEARGQLGDLSDLVGALVNSLGAGPVGGPVTGIIGSIGH